MRGPARAPRDKDGTTTAAVGAGGKAPKRATIKVKHRITMKLNRYRFPVRRPARARVVLVAADGWTPLATSRVLVLRR